MPRLRQDPPARNEGDQERTSGAAAAAAADNALVVTNQSILEGDDVEESFVSSNSTYVSAMVAHIEANLLNKNSSPNNNNDNDNNTSGLLDISTNVEDGSFLQQERNSNSNNNSTINKPEMNEPTDVIDSSDGDVEDLKNGGGGGIETATLPNSPMSNLSGGQDSGGSFSNNTTNRRKQCLFYAVMLLLLLAAVAVPVAIILSKNNDNESSSRDGTTVIVDGDDDDKEDQPPVVLATPSPTAVPTTSPSAFPSATPTTATPAPTLTFSPTLAPSSSPTATPTNAPTTAAPTATPTSAPTSSPTTATPTATPTSAPTPVPSQAPSTSAAPTGDVFSQLLQTVRAVSFAPPEAFNDASSFEYAAVQFVARTSMGTSVTATDDEDKLLQRYALAVLDFATSGSQTGTTFSNEAVDECWWTDVECNVNGTVTTVNWYKHQTGQPRTGTIPPDVALLTDLQRLDLGENALRGRIPDSLYNLEALEELYLHENRLTGTLSEDVSKLSNLVNIYLSENLLTGTFPKGLGSPGTGAANVRPLRYINLYNNSITGPFPDFLNLRNLYFFDVGYNQMTGSIPSDWYTGANSMQRMRHLCLNNNNFEGTLPEDFTGIAGGRLNTLLLAHNNFTGEFPGGWNPTNFLQAVEIQNAGFTSIDRDVCSMSVFVGGEITSLRADCAICDCGRPFCVTPICS